jgi:hypothetical protein
MTVPVLMDTGSKAGNCASSSVIRKLISLGHTGRKSSTRICGCTGSCMVCKRSVVVDIDLEIRGTAISLRG